MKTSFFKRSLSVGLASILAIAVLVGFADSAKAVQIPYVPGEPLPSIENPVFNTYTNVPNGIGNEADFVRIRPSTGNVADNGTGGVRNALYVNGLAADCNVGDKFDVRTYIHNGADEEFNDNGNGSAVAHGTKVRMTAPLGVEGETHTFTSQIMADDVSPVTDTARLYCENNVSLKLVPQSVKVVSKHYGFQTVSDSAVNGELPIGSHVLGDGNVWGCWDERVLVAYIVEVVEPEQPEEPVYSCDLLSMTFLGDRKYRFNVKATANNGAVIEEYKFNFGDGSDVVVTDKNTVEHTYAKDGIYKAFAQIVVNVNGEMKTVGSDKCKAEIDIEPEVEVCPIEGKGTLSKDDPDCKEVKGTVTELPNTGAGSVAGLMAGVTAAGTALHRRFTLRRNK